jgi:DNA (cytosine-5)-methyltransferase 1
MRKEKITCLDQRIRKGKSIREYDISFALKTMAGGGQIPLIKIPEATKQGYAIAKEGDSINLAQPNSSTRRGRVGVGVANTLDTQMEQYTLKDQRIRRLTPIECERLQGFPDNWTKYGHDGKEISDSQRYRCLGNAVSVPVVSAVIRRVFSEQRGNV